MCLIRYIILTSSDCRKKEVSPSINLTILTSKILPTIYSSVKKFRSIQVIKQNMGENILQNMPLTYTKLNHYQYQ